MVLYPDMTVYALQSRVKPHGRALCRLNNPPILYYYAGRESRKEADTLSQVFEYTDRHLYKLCDEAGIKRFCMHALRHTYATRAIEGEMHPKVLQKSLGHASSLQRLQWIAMSM